MVFLDDNEDVAETCVLSGRWRWRGLGYLSYATGKGEDAAGKREQSKSGGRQAGVRGIRTYVHISHLLFSFEKSADEPVASCGQLLLFRTSLDDSSIEVSRYCGL